MWRWEIVGPVRCQIPCWTREIDRSYGGWNSVLLAINHHFAFAIAKEFGVGSVVIRKFYPFIFREVYVLIKVWIVIRMKEFFCIVETTKTCEGKRPADNCRYEFAEDTLHKIALKKVLKFVTELLCNILVVIFERSRYYFACSLGSIEVNKNHALFVFSWDIFVCCEIMNQSSAYVSR